MNNILVTGSNGQLGSELKAVASHYADGHFIFTDVAELDITNHKVVEEFINTHRINTIINCAAYTAVDKAEEQEDLANKINHLAVANFAQIAKENTIKLIHISTDYVFDGTNHKPYVESDIPNPQSVYGRTKLAGENAILRINPKNTIIIRTSWVYSSYGNNFVKTMIRLGSERDELNVVADQIGTPTNAADLAKAILTILPKIKNEKVELFHFSNEGVCSWYDFAKTIFELTDSKITLNPIDSEHYPTPAKRPYYSVLSKNKIKEDYQIEIPYWRTSLKSMIQTIQ
jgi:dTDP-4-dehydrorhamnose reductase|tara:strand:- start:1561 stop:2421 length:861 start_codon:yes stop_codon:yes gene_type:complete